MLNMMNKQAARPLKAFLTTKECKWQFAEPHNHRVNAAEQAIQTFKNHLIGGFCCTDSEWPLQLWNNLTKQALITLNLCRTSRKHPDRSAYHYFYGKRYDWNKRPMAPPGTRTVVHEAPEGKLSWGTQGIDGWYCCPVFGHYQNMRFYVPETKAYRTSASYDLFPQHFLLPTLPEQQHNKEVAQECIESTQRLKKQAKEDGDKRLEESNRRDNKWKRNAHLRECKEGNRWWSRTSHAGDDQHQPNKPSRSQAEIKNAPQANTEQHTESNTTHNNRRARRQKIKTTKSRS